MNPQMQAITDAMDTAAGFVLFFLLVISMYALLLVSALFAALAVRGAWRWLATHTVGNVVVFLGRRALRGGR